MDVGTAEDTSTGEAIDITAAVDRDDLDMEELTDDRPVHLAKCRECPATLRYRVLLAGSHMAIERSGVDMEQSFGISAAGLPICPNGHGEMQLHDEQLLPAHEAIADAAGRLDQAVQGDLPGIIPVFNWQGAYLELESMSVEVDRLHTIWDQDAKQAKESKSAWEEASKRRDKAALEFRRRRLAKGATVSEPLASETHLVRCAWEQAHSDEECPICTDRGAAKVHGLDGSARDSQQHVEDADLLAATLDAEELADLIEAAGVIVTPRVVLGWSVEDQAEARAWADGAVGITDEKPARPKILGTAHVAMPGRNGAAQCCSMCDTVLIAGDDDANYYDEGTLVGVDCPGKPREAGHHYPQRTGKKKAGKVAGGSQLLCANGQPTGPNGKAPGWLGRDHCQGCYEETNRGVARAEADERRAKQAANQKAKGKKAGRKKAAK